jgi:hypothetical protein
MAPSDMGDGLIAESKHSNSTSIMLYLYHEMVVVGVFCTGKLRGGQDHAWSRRLPGTERPPGHEAGSAWPSGRILFILR